MTGTRTATTVSAVLIVKNEEDVLADCLEAVRWADQVVVYDTGSTDRTLDIARGLADTVVEGYWDDDFAGARNRALAHATSDWVLVVDADERIELDPVALRRRLGRGGASQHTVIVDSGTSPSAHPLAPRDLTSQFASVRFFRRGAYRYQGQIHEQVVRCAPGDGGPATPLPDVVIRHSGYNGDADVIQAKGERNLGISLAHLEQGIEEGADPRDLELRRVQVVRSYLFAGRVPDALELATSMLDEGFLVPRSAVILATGIVASPDAVQDPELESRWYDVWEAHDDNPAAARLQRARAAARRDDASAALDAIEGIPTTSLNSRGERVERVEALTTEIWALARLGRGRRAAQVARAAAAKGIAPGTPGGLAELLGRERCRTVIESFTDRLWHDYATACVMEPDRAARSFLSWMHEVRPGDPTVLAAVAVATPALSLEEASEWSVAMRSAGAVEHCPLVRIAHDVKLDPRQRAVAGALAFSAYGDERGLRGLEAALSQVPSELEAELLVDLDVVAPGLVSPAAVP